MDKPDRRLSFIHESEAGNFLAWMVEQPGTGPINAQSEGVVTAREILGYIEAKTGKTPILSVEGEAAPFHFQEELSLSLARAKEWGFSFGRLDGWIYGVLDEYIDFVSKQQS